MMMPMREIGYSDYVREIESKIPQGNFPIEGNFELTFRCVLRCKHCYTACNQYAHEEMRAEEWCRLIDEACELGMLELLITGGDPMLKGDLFKKVYTHAKKSGLSLTIFTSGTLIDEKWARFFANDPPFLIEITLYGATEPVYESVTQVKGSYQRCMAGLDWLERYQVPFKLKTVVMDLNKKEFHACEKIAKARGSKGFRFDAAIHPKLDGSDTPLQQRISPKEIVEIELAGPKETVEAARKQFQRPLKKRSSEEIVNFHCGAGKSGFFANPYGKLQVCTIVPGKEYQYDWRNGGSLKSAFYEFFPKITHSKPKRAHRCHQCNLWDVCDMCPGWAQTVHGDLETPVDFICELTHRRAIALGTDPKLFQHSMMYQRIMEGKTFPETKVPEEGFHGTGGVSLPSFEPPEESSCSSGACCGS